MRQTARPEKQAGNESRLEPRLMFCQALLTGAENLDILNERMDGSSKSDKPFLTAATTEAGVNRPLDSSAVRSMSRPWLDDAYQETLPMESVRFPFLDFERGVLYCR